MPFAAAIAILSLAGTGTWLDPGGAAAFGPPPTTRPVGEPQASSDSPSTPLPLQAASMFHLFLLHAASCAYTVPRIPLVPRAAPLRVASSYSAPSGGGLGRGSVRAQRLREIGLAKELRNDATEAEFALSLSDDSASIDFASLAAKLDRDLAALDRQRVQRTLCRVCLRDAKLRGCRSFVHQRRFSD